MHLLVLRTEVLDGSTLQKAKVRGYIRHSTPAIAVADCKRSLLLRFPNYAMGLLVKISQALAALFCHQFLWDIVETGAVGSGRNANIGGPIVAIWALPSNMRYVMPATYT